MNIAICDDEPVQLDLLERAIRRCSVEGWRPKNVYRYSSGRMLLRDLAGGRCVDCIFLDIQMPKLNGLQTYEIIVTLSGANIIFVSTHAEMLPEVFALRSPWFLYKPYTQETFDRTVRTVLEKRNSDYLYSFQADGADITIPCSRICLIRSDDHYLQVVADGVSYMSRGRLDDVEKELAPYHFFRCHRCYLINLRYYRRREGYTLLMGCRELTRVPLSKVKVSDLKSTYLKYKTGGRDAF